MDDLTLNTLFDPAIEIIPPDCDDYSRDDAMTCLCCGRLSSMDEDCCGICEECLAP